MAAMWTLFGLVLVFLFMRVYTRHACSIPYGMDDYVYLVATVRNFYLSEATLTTRFRVST